MSVNKASCISENTMLYIVTLILYVICKCNQLDWKHNNWKKNLYMKVHCYQDVILHLGMQLVCNTEQISLWYRNKAVVVYH